MRTLVLAAALAIPTASACAAQSQPVSRPPSLVVAISVDQLSTGLFDTYRPHFRGGLARLSRGIAYRNGFQSHAATETCPGHSTILTGARPARSGIIANYWADADLPREQKNVYCAEDVTARPEPGQPYAVSAYNLKVPTLGDVLKARNGSSQSVAIAGKDRSAVMMGGKMPDQRWYWSGGRFATELQDRRVPRSVTAANEAVKAMIAKGQAPLDPPPVCRERARSIALQGGGKPVGSGRLGFEPGEESGFRASPAFDGAVLALGAALIRELGLGRDSSPDVLALGLAATDYVGHAYGTGGQEMCLQLLALDRDLGDFFDYLDSTGVDYAVVLTSDHGGADVPERALLEGVGDAARVDPALAVSRADAAIAEKLGLDRPVLIGNSPRDTLFGDIYLSARLDPDQRRRVLGEALAYYRAHPQVEAVLTRESLEAMQAPQGPPDRWSLEERAKASFDPERSGDFILFLKPNITPIADTRSYAATHGSAWDYDRKVPILFWRKGMSPADRPEPIETVDIMPTLSAILGIGPKPVPVDGTCLEAVAGPACGTR